MKTILLVLIYLTVDINCQGDVKGDDNCPDAQCIEVIQETLFISLTIKDRIDEGTVEMILGWIDKSCENILEDFAPLVRFSRRAIDYKDQRKSDEELAPIVVEFPFSKLTSNHPKDMAPLKYVNGARFGEWIGNSDDVRDIDAAVAPLVDGIPNKLKRSANTEDVMEEDPKNGSPLPARFILGLFGKQTCSLNEESYCNLNCGHLTCENYESEIPNYLICVADNKRFYHRICLFGTWSKCECVLGLVRDESTQKCIPVEYCPKKHKHSTTQKPSTNPSVIDDQESKTSTTSFTTPPTVGVSVTTPTILTTKEKSPFEILEISLDV